MCLGWFSSLTRDWGVVAQTYSKEKNIITKNKLIAKKTRRKKQKQEKQEKENEERKAKFPCR